MKTLSGFALGLMLVTAACGGGNEAPSTGGATTEAPAAPAASAVDPATAGSITGKVVLDGTAPKNEPIRMNADPICVQANKTPQTQENYMVGSGGELQNVFVYVKDGLGNMVFPAPTTAVTLDQQGCRYHPHVFGIMVGQPLEIINDDPTLHNIHATPKVNTEFNTGQPIQGMKTTHTFTAKEIMMPFKCDVHGWMNSYVGIMDNPYFAVSGEDGKFELKNLPPGTYTIEAWHEKAGAQTQSVTIGAKETKDINFSFKPAATN